MADLTPTPAWTPVPQLEASTLALGGAGGPMNAQAQALLNRLEMLKRQAEVFTRRLYHYNEQAQTSNFPNGEGGAPLNFSYGVFSGYPYLEAPSILTYSDSDGITLLQGGVYEIVLRCRIYCLDGPGPSFWPERGVMYGSFLDSNGQLSDTRSQHVRGDYPVTVMQGDPSAVIWTDVIVKDFYGQQVFRPHIYADTGEFAYSFTAEAQVTIRRLGDLPDAY